MQHRVGARPSREHKSMLHAQTTAATSNASTQSCSSRARQPAHAATSVRNTQAVSGRQRGTNSRPWTDATKHLLQPAVEYFRAAPGNQQNSAGTMTGVHSTQERARGATHASHTRGVNSSPAAAAYGIHESPALCQAVALLLTSTTVRAHAQTQTGSLCACRTWRARKVRIGGSSPAPPVSLHNGAHDLQRVCWIAEVPVR